MTVQDGLDSAVDVMYQPRWLAAATALDVSPDELSTVDYICWVSQRWSTWRAEVGRGDGPLDDEDHEAFTAWLVA